MQGCAVDKNGGVVARSSRFPGQPRADGARHPVIGQVPNMHDTGIPTFCRQRHKFMTIRGLFLQCG
jgi:hypothetical protein